MSENSTTIGITAIDYVVPEVTKDLEELSQEGKLSSSPAVLRGFGFQNCRLSMESAAELASRTVQKILKSTQIDPEDVDLIVNATALPTSSLVPANGNCSFPTGENAHLDLFKYAVTKIQDDVGLVNARTIGTSELGCAALLSAVWLAQTVMEQQNLDTAVCVNADVLPAFVKREVIYNVISDAACAVLLRRGVAKNRVIAFEQMTKGFYWDCETRQNELIASYFPTSKRLISNALKRAGLGLKDISLLIPHNVSLRSWEILSRLIEYPLDRIYLNNVLKKGHSIAADNFINLKDAIDEGKVKPGDHVLLFCFGLGAHWGCCIIQI